MGGAVVRGSGHGPGSGKAAQTALPWTPLLQIERDGWAPHASASMPTIPMPRPWSSSRSPAVVVGQDERQASKIDITSCGFGVALAQTQSSGAVAAPEWVSALVASSLTARTASSDG